MNVRGLDCLFLLFGIFLLLSTLYAGTVQSIVSVWWYSETFSHGFLILPACFWLAWKKRSEFMSTVSPSSIFPMLLVIPSGFIWLLANLVGLQVLEQLAFVFVCCFTVWAVLGHARARILWFPITFMLFAAPVGDELVPRLMEVTADFTVTLIRVSGIPVYREGLYFSLPSGNWSVVEACSGIRYLIASFTMGVLYAHLNFKRIHAALIFVMLSAVVPIVANGLRAYGIVMVGHYSDMALATGFDHLVYGWFFFGIIMFLLFSLGRFLKNIFEKDSYKEQVGIQDSRGSSSDKNRRIEPSVSRLAVIVITLAFWPGLAKYIDSRVPKAVNANIIESVVNRLDGTEQWNLVPGEIASWLPDYHGYDSVSSALFTDNESMRVEIKILTYLYQQQGKELIQNQNVLAPANSDDWKIASEDTVNILTDDGRVKLLTSQLSFKEKRITVWYWNIIDEKIVTDDLLGKLYEAKNKIFFEEKPSYVFFLVVEDKGEISVTLLDIFFKFIYARFLTGFDSSPLLDIE